MTLEVLIPCLDKTKDEILGLCDFLKIESDARFCNQCSEDSLWNLSYHGHRVSVFNVSWRGVSRARNALMMQCQSDVALFIDDDCVLTTGYAFKILEAYTKHPNAVAIRFNTTREHWNPVHAESDADCRATFRDLSSFGMWGLSFNTRKLGESGVRFKEYLGAPNYLYNGEDSIFLYDLCKATKEVYLNPFFICDVQETKPSTWFDQFDDQYFVTKGFVYSYLYGRLWRLALLRMYCSYRKMYGLKWKQIKKAARVGHGMFIRKDYGTPGFEK